MYDFDHARRRFFDLDGDLQPRSRRRDFESVRAKLRQKLRQIKRGCGRHWLPRRFPGIQQHLQCIGFFSHAVFTASRVPEFCRDFRQ